MAKRFTDSEKWKDDWYISLDNDSKIVWQWLLDNCSHTGLCKRSISLLNMMCKVHWTEKDMIEKMDNRVQIVNGHWFIAKFIKFQYSTLLSGKPAIISVVKDLFTYKLIDLIPESFGNDYLIINKSFENHLQMIKDMVKVKDMVKDKTNSSKNQKKAKSIKDGYAYFEDGARQELGHSQLLRFNQNDLQPGDVILGQIR